MLRATLYSSSLSVLPTFALFQHCKLFLFIIAIVTILHCLCLRLDVTTVHDDCQVYLSTSVEDVPLTVSKFAACIADIKAWLRTCRLRLNAAKTQLLWLGSSQLLDKVDCHDVLVLGTRVAIWDTACDLGVVIDSELSLSAHVTAVCRSGYNQLRQLRPVVRSLSMNATKTLVQAFISCRLDYCNSLLYGISDGLLQRLQSRAERCRSPGHRRPS